MFDELLNAMDMVGFLDEVTTNLCFFVDTHCHDQLLVCLLPQMDQCSYK